MGPTDEKLPAFQALSYGDKFRVHKCLARGEAPSDPRMAAAAVELAESYQSRSKAYTALMRWGPLILIVCWGYLTVAAVVDGDPLMLIIRAPMLLWGVWLLMFGPAIRPKNMARSLAASRRLVASGS